MELDKEKINKRIKELKKELYVPPEGRTGGAWENESIDELKRLNELLSYIK